MSDKKTKGRKKGRPGKLPKRVAGVKIPKELRKTGEALLATAASTMGREMLTAGVAAILANAATRMQTPRDPGARPTAPDRPDTPPPVAPPPITPAFDPEEAGAQMARRVFEAIGIVARTINTPPVDSSSRH